ncbi:hypothetical protein AB1J28_22700 [Lysinibacillus irui]
MGKPDIDVLIKPEHEFVNYKTFETVASKTVEGSSQRIIAKIPGY